MKNLLIIGARGLGREVYNMLPNCLGYNESFIVKGFLDDKTDALKDMQGYPPIIDSVENYSIKDNDVFFCALGNIYYKKKYCEIINKKGGIFISLLHKKAEISKTSQIGTGCLVDRFSIIGSDSVVGNNVLIQAFAIIGHDCIIGDYSRIDTHCTCVGGTKICSGVTIYTNSVINEGVVVGENSTVGAMSFVIRKVKPGTTVCGNPARKLDF